MGNKSGSIEDRAVKFSCSMGFMAMANRMLWPSSLSRGRKWLRITKCTHLRVVGLRLEGNLVINVFHTVQQYSGKKGLICLFPKHHSLPWLVQY